MVSAECMNAKKREWSKLSVPGKTPVACRLRLSALSLR